MEPRVAAEGGWFDTPSVEPARLFLVLHERNDAVLDTQTSLSSGPWRVARSTAGSVDATPLIQPDRLDVLVHLRAFEELARKGPAAGGVTSDDWLAFSESFSTVDNEIGVVALAAELLTSPDYELEVAFASGGQLVRGATAAAAALHTGRPIVRIDAVPRVLDRSAEALRSTGRSASELFAILETWVRTDPGAAVVLVDLAHDGAADLDYELRCRYPVMSETIDHISRADATELGIATGGSVRIVCIRAGGPTFAQVIEQHRSAIVMARRGLDVTSVLQVVHAPDRVGSTSPSHEQLLRKVRRAERRERLLGRALGR